MQINSHSYNTYSHNSLPKAQTPKLVAFEGLTSVLKRQAFESPKDIALLVNKLPNTFVGSFPKEWIDLIPVGKRAQTIKQVQKGFSDAINTLQQPNIAVEKEVREFVSKNAGIMNSSDTSYLEKVHLLVEYTTKAHKDTFSVDLMEEAGLKLEKVLVKNGLCKQSKLTYAGGGGYGDVYKLQMDDKEYALKVFSKYSASPDDNVFEAMMDDFHVEDFREEMKSHGYIAEPNRALFWQKNAREHQNAKMYFSDLKNGGSVSEFISPNAPYPNKQIEHKLFGLEHTDLGKTSNSINGIIVDGGGQRIVNKTIAQNTSARKIYYKIGKQPVEKQAETWNVIFKTAKANRADVELGLMNALELMDVETIGKLDIPPKTLDKWVKSTSLPYSIKMQLVQKKLYF